MKAGGKNKLTCMGAQHRGKPRKAKREMEIETENGEGQRVREEFLNRDVIIRSSVLTKNFTICL